MNPATALVSIKFVHTLVWVFLVACILGIPLAAHVGRFGLASTLIAVVLVEILILVINRWRCPLTSLAGRYTHERHDNFDIYLPLWLAKHNKLIFGVLFVVGLIYTAIAWWR